MDLEPLMLLLQAPSKDVVNRIVIEAFNNRRAAGGPHHVSPSLTALLREQLGVTDKAELDLLVQALLQLISKCLYESLSEEGIQALFSHDFHPHLRRLLAQIIAKHQLDWREQAIRSQIGLPHLESVSWDICEQSSSAPDVPSQAPKAILKLQVKDSSSSKAENSSSIRFEVTKASVTAMLDSLYIVRDQLDSIVR